MYITMLTKKQVVDYHIDFSDFQLGTWDVTQESIM